MTDQSTRQSAGQDQLRLMTMAARLYHERGGRQRDIAARLGISQPRVSRLLALAEEHGIVRTVVVAPDGLYPELEEEVEDAYGVREVHVVDVLGGDQAIPRDLGGAAARYLTEAAPWGPVVGFTSWSSTLREMTRMLAPIRRSGTAHVVEMLGDLGSPLLQHEAGQATLRLARQLGAEPVLLRTPGVAASPDLRAAAEGDAHVTRALRLLDRVDVAFVGLGPADFHGPLQEGDNFFSAEQLAAVRAAGAAGQLNQRFIDAAGARVETPLDELVVSATLDQLRAAGTRIVVAGGTSKWGPLAAALAGGWVDVLVTDLNSALQLAGRRTSPDRTTPGRAALRVAPEPGPPQSHRPQEDR
jgi:DNA-binding transcriptional regulator LsrR (DeoR family)